MHGHTDRIQFWRLTKKLWISLPAQPGGVRPGMTWFDVERADHCLPNLRLTFADIWEKRYTTVWRLHAWSRIRRLGGWEWDVDRWDLGPCIIHEQNDLALWWVFSSLTIALYWNGRSAYRRSSRKIWRILRDKCTLPSHNGTALLQLRMSTNCVTEGKTSVFTPVSFSFLHHHVLNSDGYQAYSLQELWLKRWIVLLPFPWIQIACTCYDIYHAIR